MSDVLWYRCDPNLLAAETMGLPDDKRLAYYDSMLKGLLLCQLGINPCADSMIREREISLAKSAAGGRKGAPARWPKQQGANRGCTGGVQGVYTPPTPLHDTDTDRDTDRDTDKTETKTRPDPDVDTATRARAVGGEDGAQGDTEGPVTFSGSDSGSAVESFDSSPSEETRLEVFRGEAAPTASPTEPSPSPKATKGKHPIFSWEELQDDKYGYLNSIDNVMLVDFVLWYDGEPRNKRAKGVYEAYVRKHGHKAFRNLVEKHVADTESGEEPNNRGASFMSLLYPAEGGAHD